MAGPLKFCGASPVGPLRKMTKKRPVLNVVLVHAFALLSFVVVVVVVVCVVVIVVVVSVDTTHGFQGIG